MEVESREELLKLPYYLTEDGKKRYLHTVMADYWWELYDEYGRILEEHYGNSYTYYHYDDVKHIRKIESFDQDNSTKRTYVREYYPWDYVNPSIDPFDHAKRLQYCREHSIV
jgi:hypothetical protein